MVKTQLPESVLLGGILLRRFASGLHLSTVNLDAESAHDTIFSLKKLMEGRTTIMAAHNEELMKAADCVIRLENGKIMKQE